MIVNPAMISIASKETANYPISPSGGQDCDERGDGCADLDERAGTYPRPSP
jgi:hypothetical protein